MFNPSLLRLLQENLTIRYCPVCGGHIDDKVSDALLEDHVRQVFSNAPPKKISSTQTKKKIGRPKKNAPVISAKYGPGADQPRRLPLNPDREINTEKLLKNYLGTSLAVRNILRQAREDGTLRYRQDRAKQLYKVGDVNEWLLTNPFANL